MADDSSPVVGRVAEMATPVTFFFDPACPWTWITARWLTEVSERRDLAVTWRLFSLRFRNKDNPGYDWIRDELDAQHPAMRVLAATEAVHGNAAVGRLYTSLGTLIHHDRDGNLERLAEGIAAAGLPADLIAAGDEQAWDEVIEASTLEGWALVGDDAGIPIVQMDGAVTTYFGPVLSPAPTGDDALALWDALVTLGRLEGVYEIKRTRSVGPQFGARP